MLGGSYVWESFTWKFQRCWTVLWIWVPLVKRIKNRSMFEKFHSLGEPSSFNGPNDEKGEQLNVPRTAVRFWKSTTPVGWQGIAEARIFYQHCTNTEFPFRSEFRYRVFEVRLNERITWKEPFNRFIFGNDEPILRFLVSNQRFSKGLKMFLIVKAEAPSLLEVPPQHSRRPGFYTAKDRFLNNLYLIT